MHFQVIMPIYSGQTNICSEFIHLADEQYAQLHLVEIQCVELKK
mgnify:CR=1 FL=1